LFPDVPVGLLVGGGVVPVIVGCLEGSDDVGCEVGISELGCWVGWLVGEEVDSCAVGLGAKVSNKLDDAGCEVGIFVVGCRVGCLVGDEVDGRTVGLGARVGDELTLPSGPAIRMLMKS